MAATQNWLDYAKIDPEFEEVCLHAEPDGKPVNVQ